MSFAYDIRNLKDCQDYKQKRADFFRTLHLQQKLNRNYEQAMTQRYQMEKLGIQPIGEAPRSLEDEKKDFLLQQNLLLKNALTIMKPEEARKLLFLLNNQEVYDFNTHFKGISEAVKGRTNISADFMKRVFQRYLLVLKATGGTGIPIPLSEETLSKLPGDIVDGWQNFARGSIDPTTGGPYDLNDLIRNTAAAVNRTPEDVAREVKMEMDAEAQTEVPIQQYVKRKREEVEAEAVKRARTVQTDEELMAELEEPRGTKRVKEEPIFLPQKKLRLQQEVKGSLKRRQDEEVDAIKQSIKRAREGPGPDPVPFRRGQKRLARNTLEAELVKRQKIMEVSKKRAGEPLTRQERPSKKLKEMYAQEVSRYIRPQALTEPLEEAFAGYEQPSVLQQAKEEATRAIRRRASKRAKELTAGETALQKAKREATAQLQARTEARAREIESGQGLFISPQEGTTKNYSFIQTRGGAMSKRSRQMRMIGRGVAPKNVMRGGSYGDDEMKRFMLLKGIVIAGNNDPSILRELKGYIAKFTQTGQINKQMGRDLMGLMS